MLRHLQLCKYCFLVATFVFGPMVCLHDGGLGHGRDHFLFALVLCILHLVVHLSHCRLFFRWAILFALFLFLCALLHLGFGEVVHSFVCVLLAGGCSIMLRREGLLDRRHRDITSQRRCWSWYPSWFRRHITGREEHVTSLLLVRASFTIGDRGRVISVR